MKKYKRLINYFLSNPTVCMSFYSSLLGSTGNMFSVVFTHPPPSHLGSVRLLPSETREGWPLLPVETEVNGDSKSTNEQMKGVLPWLGLGACRASTRDLLNYHCIADAGLPILMIGEVSWEPKRRWALASQHIVTLWLGVGPLKRLSQEMDLAFDVIHGHF